MRMCKSGTRRAALVMAALAVVALPGFAATVQIDLDRNTAGIQNALNVPAGTVDVVGAVVVSGDAADTIGTNVTQVLVAEGDGGDRIDPPNSGVANGELAFALPPSGNVTATDFVWTNAFPVAADIGGDGFLTVFLFNIRLANVDAGDDYVFSFQGSAANPALGLSVEGSNFSYGQGGENPAIATTGGHVTIDGQPQPTVTPTEDTDPTPTETQQQVEPTATPTILPCADAGYYVLTTFGNHVPVGNPPHIGGSLAGPNQNYGDMEVAKDDPDGDEDLAIMDKFGVVTWVQDNTSNPGQTYAPLAGGAVDVVVSQDSNAFYVLSQDGLIRRGGDASPGAGQETLGNDADDLAAILGVPFPAGLRDPNFGGAGDGATLRAVGLAVVPGPSNASPRGYIVIDSQGGHYLFDGAGNEITPAANGTGVLDANLEWPFFPGLDIAREIELHPNVLLLPVAMGAEAVNGNGAAAVEGLIVYDGWGGTHPVPVDVESPVRFIRNETAVGSGIPLTTVGLPYLIIGFDNPETGANEGTTPGNIVGADVNSIFVDLEFCNGRNSEGVYVMDKFGGVFAFGSTRANPSSTATLFNGSPYFFPFLYAADMEPMEDETVFDNNHL